MINFVIRSYCSILYTPGLVEFATKANTHTDSTKRCALEDGLDLPCFDGAGVRLAADTYDGQASDEQIAGSEDVILE